jgi:hypothetical protein
VFSGTVSKIGALHGFSRQTESKSQDSSWLVMRLVFVLIASGIIIVFIDTYVAIAVPGHQDISLGIAVLLFVVLAAIAMLLMKVGPSWRPTPQKK